MTVPLKRPESPFSTKVDLSQVAKALLYTFVCTEICCFRVIFVINNHFLFLVYHKGIIQSHLMLRSDITRFPMCCFTHVPCIVLRLSAATAGEVKSELQCGLLCIGYEREVEHESYFQFGSCFEFVKGLFSPLLLDTGGGSVHH